MISVLSFGYLYWSYFTQPRSHMKYSAAMYYLVPGCPCEGSLSLLRCKRLLWRNNFHAKLFLTRCKSCKRLPRINFKSEQLLSTTNTIQRTELKDLVITFYNYNWIKQFWKGSSLQTLTVQIYKTIFSKIYWTIIEHYKLFSNLKERIFTKQKLFSQYLKVGLQL